MKPNDENRIDEVVNMILSDYEDDRTINHIDICNQPDKKAIVDVVEKLLKILYPGYYSDKVYRIYTLKNNMSATIEDVIFHLNKQISIVLKYQGIDDSESEKITLDFLSRIPRIRKTLETDVEAGFEGDPAAAGMDEIILSYPGLYAISIYRMAHELALLGVPMIPRIMTEYAHGKTGIDIHPGAIIGDYFFIDHGTGIVIGETTVIGDHVKIYQGVTLGGLSTRGGQSLKGKKRHPTIGNNVTIYSNASILGGETVIGENTVIGGNTFITRSIDANTRVSIKNLEMEYHTNNNEKRVGEICQSDEW
ncbi:serine acetyltransferase [Lachnospiraceae bacterium JC7]|nr:serine acetyltransferase [Lachnospiraceae bacterium JC7]